MTPCPSCTTPFVPEPRKMHLCPSCLAERESWASKRRERQREMKEAPIPCLRCQQQYERKGGSGNFCKRCGEARDNEQRRVRRKRAKEEYQEALAQHPDWTLPDSLDDFVEAGHGTNDGKRSTVPDGAPQGVHTPLGPEEGRSTFFADLRGRLDSLSKQAAAHEWFKVNRHWAFHMGEPLSLIPYDLAPGPKCGDQQGTHRGYNRHRYAKEMACPACLTAEREYTAERRRPATESTAA